MNGQLSVLPFGQLNDAQHQALKSTLSAQPECWAKRLEALAEQFDWILLDTPNSWPRAWLGPHTQWLEVVEADAPCHVLLARQPRQSPVLINRFDASQRLQRDLALLWQHQYPTRLLGFSIHADAAVAEALAAYSPLSAWAPESLALQDIKRLATWCLTGQSMRK